MGFWSRVWGFFTGGSDDGGRGDAYSPDVSSDAPVDWGSFRDSSTIPAMPEGVEVAGWGDRDRGSWNDTQRGDSFPTESDLRETDLIVVVWKDQYGIEHYRTIDFPVDGYDGLADAIADMMDRYSGE